MSKRILYGDDNELNRNELSRRLRLKNYEVDLASYPQEFLTKSRIGDYDALVTDLEYAPHGREGYDVLKQVRELPALKVLFSGVAGFEYEAEAYESGADFAIMRKDSSALLKLLDKELKGGEKENAK